MLQDNDLLQNELTIDAVAQIHLKETAKWAKFLGITGFIFSILIALAGVFAGSMINVLSGGLNRGGGGAIASGAIMIVYLVLAAVIFFTTLYLYKFGSKMQSALKTNDQESLNLSFQNLKIYYRIVGVLTVVYLGILLLAIIFASIAALMRMN